MHGVGRASGAISIVNALPTGVGCAHGVRLYASASVELSLGSSPHVEIEPPASDTELVRKSVAAALDRFRPSESADVHLRIDSEIPPACGLKSSSAVASATVQGVATALGIVPEPEEVARLAAAVGRAVGLSATGAFDDALAGLIPGFVLTDNRVDQLLRRGFADPEWTAVVHVPPETHSPSPALVDRFRSSGQEGEAASEAARRGEWLEAMLRNTQLVERAMGYDYARLRASLLDSGALGAGVSGMGPALVALAPRDRATAVLERMPASRFIVPLTSESHP